jgi:uncharacterized membrane protein YgcG
MNARPVQALLAATWLLACSAHAEDHAKRIATPFPIPDRYTLVNDYAGVLRISRRPEIKRKLEDLERRNGTQIVFLSVPNTGKGGADAYGQAVFAKWDIGNHGQGNGVLFLVGNDNSLIFTGPGIAGGIPDATLARIYRDLLVPAWNRDEMSEGVEATLDALVKAAWGEETAPTAYDYAHPYVPKTPEQIMAAVLAAIAVAYVGCLLWYRRRNRTPEAP